MTGTASRTTTGPREALRVDGVWVSYGGVAAVRGVDLKVHSGETVALLGPNGAGKTSLLRTVSGAVPLRRGRIAVDGKEVARCRPDQILRAGLGHVLEGRHLFGAMTVDENLRLGATIRRDRALVMDDLDRLYDAFPGLAAKRRQRAMHLSGGQQQMVAISRAVMARPRVLLLDEPSLGLAPVMLESVADIIAWANGQLGVAVLVVEQHVSLALSITTRGYVMVNGRIVLEASSASLADGRAIQDAYLGAAVEPSGSDLYSGAPQPAAPGIAPPPSIPRLDGSGDGVDSRPEALGP